MSKIIAELDVNELIACHAERAADLVCESGNEGAKAPALREFIRETEDAVGRGLTPAEKRLYREAFAKFRDGYSRGAAAYILEA